MTTELQELLTIVRRRRSVRHFRPDPVPETALQRIMEAARWAPSGGNGQNYLFGVITDQRQREALANAAGNQQWVAEAPVIIACCARLHRPAEEGEFSRRVNELRWGEAAWTWINSCPDPYYQSLFLMNSAPLIPGAHIQLAAAACGLGTCWIGYLDIARASEILQLPADVRCYFLMPLGWPAETEARPSSRKPLSEITFGDAWGQGWPPAAADDCEPNSVTD